MATISLTAASLMACVDFAGVTPRRLRQSCATLTLWTAKTPEPRQSLDLDHASAAPAMKAHDSPDGDRPGGHAAQLLEQLMQIARISALEEMASGIAHELNQPIGAIATFAQAGERMLGRPEPMTRDAAEVLRQISNEALNAGKGIHRIRQLFNEPPVPRTPCPVRELIAELLPVLELLAARAHTRLDISIDDGLPPVLIDRLRIQYMLFALVQNALEATRQNGAPAQVRIEVTGDRYAVLTSVIDHGVGLSSEVRDHLFRPFFTTRRNGAGLGLASSRAIIESHEGTIGFDDVEGGGARFWFRLPAAIGATTT